MDIWQPKPAGAFVQKPTVTPCALRQTVGFCLIEAAKYWQTKVKLTNVFFTVLKRVENPSTVASNYVSNGS